MKNFKIRLNTKQVTSFLFLLLSALYFYLACHKVFSYDEAYTIGMINNSYSDILKITSRDVHSPLYYWLLKLFCNFLGGNTLFLSKFFSWIFMVAFLLSGRKICRKIYNEKVELFWLFCAGFMPAMIIQATTTRMYTLALFLMTLATYYAYCLCKNDNIGKWILFTLLSILLTYIHTFCMLEMVIIYIFMLIYALIQKRHELFKKTLISGIIVSICYLPWLFVLVHQFLRWAGIESGWSNTITEFGIKSLYDYFAEWFSSLENPNTFAILFGIGLLLVCSYYTISYSWRKKDFMPVLSLIVISITVLIAIAVSILIVPCFLGRYVFPLFGGLWLFAAIGIAEIKKKWVQAVICAMTILVGSHTYVQEIRLENSYGLNQYTSFLEQYANNQVIMADSYFTMMLSIYNPDAKYMIWGGISECFPFSNSIAFTNWKQLESTDVVWYISLKNFRIGNLKEQFEIAESIEISYSYYEIVVEKYVRK